MRKDLYDVIEDFDSLRLELGYLLHANRCLIETELKEVYLKDSELLSLVSGIEFTNQNLLKRFENISSELMKVHKQS